MARQNKSSGAGRFWRGGMLVAAAMLGFALFTGGETVAERQSVAASGWGAESLVELRADLGKISPIALANACGMGASSCFKCHNGTRAGAPKMDPAKSPWHVDHKKVNNSCVGCHKGNPRLMKEELAHAGLLKGPRGGAEACGGCHKADLAKVEATYKSVTGGSK